MQIILNKSQLWTVCNVQLTLIANIYETLILHNIVIFVPHVTHRCCFGQSGLVSCKCFEWSKTYLLTSGSEVTADSPVVIEEHSAAPDEPMSREVSVQLAVGDWIAVPFDDLRRWYPGQILDIVEAPRKVKVRKVLFLLNNCSII